mgnify:CR=1 FL=1
MVVLILTACPPGLRGHLTRWLLEVSPGVFVGVLTARVRDRTWARTKELCKDGRAIMVYSTNGEQRLAFRVHRHDWEPVDRDGLMLMLRPADSQPQADLRPGWSSVGRMRRARRISTAKSK